MNCLIADSPPSIDCEPCTELHCYLPEYYDLQCDLGFFITVDFLYWYARENNLVWSTKAVVQTYDNIKGVASPLRHLYLNSHWNPGIRCGIGKTIGCDGWDLYLNWLYTHNTMANSAHFSWDGNPIPDIDQKALYNPWAYGSWFAQSFWQNGTSSWQLNFDLMDFELGRKYWVSPSFTMRPLGGLRGTWLHTRFRVKTDSTLPTVIQFDPALLTTTKFVPVFQENANFIRNTYWGIGLLAGLQSSWEICDKLFIFGSCSGSFVCGRFFGSNIVKAHFQGMLISPENGETPQEFSMKNHENEAFHRMQAMLDLALGLHWENYWFCNRLCTSLDISWEYHYWPNFGLRHQTTGSFNDDTLPLLNFNANINSYYLTDSQVVTDLVLGGLVIRGRVDF